MSSITILLLAFTVLCLVESGHALHRHGKERAQGGNCFRRVLGSTPPPRPTTTVPPTTEAPSPIGGATDFFSFCADQQDCDVQNRSLVISLPVSAANAAKTFGFIFIRDGGRLEVVSSAPNSQFTLRTRSVLVTSGGELRVGYASAPFGTDGSRFTIALYGAESDDAINCKDATCGVPNPTWTSEGATLLPNPSLTGDLDYFYRYQPLVLEPSGSANFFGKKVVAVAWGGILELHGAMGALPNSDADNIASSGASWSRVAAPVATGTNVAFGVDNTAQFSSSYFPTTPFRAFLSSTDWYPSHNEVVNVTLQRNGGSVSFVADSVKYPHLGQLITLAPGVSPNVTRRSGDFRAALGVIDRSITIISEGDQPNTPLTNHWGGHVIVRQGFGTFKISGVLLEKLGQGGVKGRYPIHFHMLRKNDGSKKLYVRDSSIYDSNTRFVTIHGTHGAVVERNVALECFGHGFFLEDGAEIYNRIAWNLAAFAKSGFMNNGGASKYAHNPRNNSGIFAHPGAQTFPYPQFPGASVDLSVAIAREWLSDYLTPTLFWIRNSYNYIHNNMAVGTEFSGVCYWFVSGQVNRPSSAQRWDNTHIYAYLQQTVAAQAATQGISTQNLQQGSTPTLRFDANAGFGCSALIMTIFDYGSNALINGFANNAQQQLAPGGPTVPWAYSVLNTRYNYAMNTPTCSTPTGCDFEFPQPAPPNTTIDTNPFWCPDNATSTAACLACGVSRREGELCGNSLLVITNFTGAFAHTELNFAAVWLRTQYFLFTDAWIGDLVGGGINFANSGDPTGVSVGYWGLVYRSVFLGSTQSGSLYADPRGPITPELSAATGLRCAKGIWGPGLVSAGPDLCIIADEGMVFSYNVAGISYHALHIYDGPLGVFSAHFANITADVLDCFGVQAERLVNGTDRPWCVMPGISKNGTACINPNAAVGWKQNNGFDYPLNYAMKDLSFENVQLRHHVYLPQFLSGTFDNDIPATLDRFCTANPPQPVSPCSNPDGQKFECPPCTPAQCAKTLCTGIFCLDNNACSNFGYIKPVYTNPSLCPASNTCCDPSNPTSFCGNGSAPACCPGCQQVGQGGACGCQAGTPAGCGCCDTCCDARYCVNDQTFRQNYIDWSSNWNTIDRQTNLKELDGSLTLRKTVSGEPGFVINNDVFFQSPNWEVECSSLGTSIVAPRHYGRIYILPNGWNSPQSCRTFSSQNQCIVIRTHRLSYDVTPDELPVPPVIAAGPKGGQGQMYSEGTRYLLELLENPQSGTSEVPNAALLPRNQLYYLQVLYPSPKAVANTFIVYVGSTFNPATALSFCIFNKVGTRVSEPIPGGCTVQQNWAQKGAWVSQFLTYSFNASSGFLSVTVNHTALPQSYWVNGERERCVPYPFCVWNDAWSSCQCGLNKTQLQDSQELLDTCVDLCTQHGGVLNAECPGGGCLGFSFQVPDVPYTPPYGGNATDYLLKNQDARNTLLEQWPAVIRNQKFIGAPVGDREC